MKDILKSRRPDLWSHPELREVLRHKSIRSMGELTHHGRTDCLSHSIRTAERAYRMARRLRLDFIAAARSALLHDLYLYDLKGRKKGMHIFRHPRISLNNAESIFNLTKRERNAILRHMWPLTPVPPRYPEAMIVSLADKIAALQDYFDGIKSRVKSLRTRRGGLRRAFRSYRSGR